jgi:uncharacterized membrane protein YqjE
MAEVPSPPSGGMFASLRRLLETSLAIAQSRFDLFVVELKEERCRVIEILILVCATIFLASMAVTMVTFTIVFLFWDSARNFVLVGFSVLYIGAAGFGYWLLRKRLKEGELPFADSLRELKKDGEWLKSQS